MAGVRDGTWMKAKNSKGKEGLVPVNFLQVTLLHTRVTFDAVALVQD